MSSLSPDAPLTDPNKDLFGVAPFAETLANGLLKMFQPEGFVVALHGPWGSGKTTVLNFVRHHLDRHNLTLEDNEKPITIIDFDPWWFSGREDLTRQFFEAFGMGLSKKWEHASTLVETFGLIVNAVSPIKIPAENVVKIIENWKDPAKKTVRELKQKVNEELSDEGRILVIIDDIDRLTDAEIREVFQVIKAIGDFSNVIYLLAYDREVVRNSLKGAQGNSRDDFRDDYLEKIIQASFDIPNPAEWNVAPLFLHEFSQILQAGDHSFLELGRERRIVELIVSFVDTPRKMKRFLNALRLSYPAIQREVNPIDFAGIEAIRVFYPPLYHYIQKYEDEFLDPYPFLSSAQDKEKIELTLSSVITETSQKNRDALIDLIRQLFPVVNAALDQTQKGLGREEDRARLKAKCISASQKFPIYFRWSIPEGGFSSEEFASILALTGDPEIFEAKLRALLLHKKINGESRIIEFLRLFYANLDHVPQGNLSSVILAFVRIGDTLLPVIGDYSDRSRIRKSPPLVEEIVPELLNKMNQSERLDLLSTVIEKGGSLMQISSIVQVIGMQYGWYGFDKISEEKRLLTVPQFKELELLLAKKIQNAADNGSLIKNNGLSRILSTWMAASPSSIESIREWARNCVTDPDNLIRFIDQVYFDGDRIISPFNYYTEYDSPINLIDPYSLRDIARDVMALPDISDRERDILKNFTELLNEGRTFR